MHKVNVIYYEGWLNRTIQAKLFPEKVKGRPFRISTKAEYPIVPRAGDRIFFPLSENDAQYFKCEERNGKSLHSGIVQWVEMIDNSPMFHVVVTDEEHHGRGEYDGNPEEKISKL